MTGVASSFKLVQGRRNLGFTDINHVVRTVCEFSGSLDWQILIERNWSG